MHWWLGEFGIYGSMGNVWTFMELQLTALSALAPAQRAHKFIGAKA